MISVSDILARVAVVQAGIEERDPAASLTPSTSSTCSSVDESAACAELLSFIARFAALGPSPESLRPAGKAPSEGDLPTEAGLPVDDVDDVDDVAAQREHLSHDSVQPFLESGVLAWVIENDPALHVVVDPVRNGTALPPDGDSLPGDAAIVAALLDDSQVADEQPASELARNVAFKPAFKPAPEVAFGSARKLVSEGDGVLGLGGTSAAPSSQPVAAASQSGALANMSHSSSPTLAAAAEPDEGLSSDKSAAARGSGVPSVVTQAPASGGSDAAQQGLVSTAGLSPGVAPSQVLTSALTPAPAPAREPVPANAPASSAETNQATAMDFLLQNEGHNRTWGKEHWAEGLSRQLMIMSRDGLGSARLRLDPPSLGMLSIQIQMTEQGTSVSFVAQHPAVRDALEQQASRLQELFKDQELNLLDVSVSDQEARERDTMDHAPRSWQEVSDEVDTEEQITQTHSHHLINERV